jgi:hypothetical protein
MTGILAGPAFTPHPGMGSESHPYSAVSRQHASMARQLAHKLPQQTAPLPALAEAQQVLTGRREPADGDVLARVLAGLRELPAAPPAARKHAAPGARLPLYEEAMAAVTGPQPVPGARADRAEPYRHGDPVDDGGALRDELAAMYRAGALATFGLPDWCTDCAGSLCARHAGMHRRALRTLDLAERIAACPGSFDAIRLLLAEGGAVAGD